MRYKSKVCIKLYLLNESQNSYLFLFVFVVVHELQSNVIMNETLPNCDADVKFNLESLDPPDYRKSGI